MKKYFILFACAVVFATINQTMDDAINSALQNSKRGIYYALSNLKKPKAKLENKLVAENKLYASVKLSKEVNGVKVESTGYHDGAEVTIVVYRSFADLIKEGFIEDDSEYKIEEFEQKKQN